MSSRVGAISLHEFFTKKGEVREAFTKKSVQSIIGKNITFSEHYPENWGVELNINI